MPFIVGMGGTLRAGSTSELMVRAVLDICETHGATTKMFDGPALSKLPHYDPYNPQRTDEEMELVEAFRSADGIVLASPGYHGGVSGLLKNAIDLLEELRSDDRPYFDGRPVGLMVSAAGWQAGGVTLTALRSIVHSMRGWPTPMGIAINSVEQKPFDQNGNLVDEKMRAQIDEMARQISIGCVGLSQLKMELSLE